MTVSMRKRDGYPATGQSLSLLPTIWTMLKRPLKQSGGSQRKVRLQFISFCLLLAVVFTAVTTIQAITNYGYQSERGGFPWAHASRYTREQQLLKQITEECARRQDNVIRVSPLGTMVVEETFDPDAPCPLLDIPLTKRVGSAAALPSPAIIPSMT